MANTSGHSEEQNAYRKETSKDGVQEILGRIEKYLGDWIKDADIICSQRTWIHLIYILGL